MADSATKAPSPGRKRGALHGFLSLLSPEELACFLTLRAEDHSIPSARAEMYRRYPQAEPYSLQTFQGYCQSEHYQKEYDRAVAGVRGLALRESFAEKASRVRTHVEMGQKTLSIWRDEMRRAQQETEDRDSKGVSGVRVKKLKDLGTEVRMILQAIQDEMQPVAKPDEVLKSTVELFFAQAARAQADSKAVEGGKSLPAGEAHALPS